MVTFVFCCRQKFTREELELHHLKKWEHTHKTTLEESSLTCDCCHEDTFNELHNKLNMVQLNQKIRDYKKSKG